MFQQLVKAPFSKMVFTFLFLPLASCLPQLATKLSGILSSFCFTCEAAVYTQALLSHNDNIMERKIHVNHMLLDHRLCPQPSFMLKHV